MKYLFILLFTFPAFACLNKISPLDLQKVIESGDPSQAETLTYKGEDGVCFDGIDLRLAELIDNEVIDFIRKEKAVSCLDEADCLKKESEQICDIGKVIRTETEVYCAVEAYKKDGVKLVESEAKKAAKMAADKAKEDAEKVKADKCKSFTFKGNTIAQLKVELNESLECR